MPALGNYNIRKFFARLNIRLVHWFNGQQILVDNGIKRSSSFVYVTSDSAQYAYIGIGIDK